MIDLGEIPLKNRAGEVVAHAIVDVDAWPTVSRYHWHLGPGGYAFATYDAGLGRLKWRHVRLHRFLLSLQPGDGREVDHINRDRLDNRLANLRLATHAENQQNITVKARSRSGFRGVETRRDGYFDVRGCLRGKRVYLGRYRTAEEAAEVAAEWRAKNLPFSSEAIRAAIASAEEGERHE